MPEITGIVKVSKVLVEKVEAVGSTDSVTPTANGTAENGVSSTSPEKKSPEKSEGEVLLAQGKRHLFVKDYPNAVAALGDACAKLSEMYGDLADECAEAYFYYGRALLELAREDNNVLGQDPEKESSEEDEEEEEGEDEKATEDGEAEAKPEAGEENKEESKVNENKDENESVADETIDTTKEIGEEGEDTTAEGKEEDVDNLQLAWEVFELAKKIFERQNSDSKLAETYLYLGEIGLESENYGGAIDDMKRCVEIQKRILPSDHRDLAETYFQLGVACSLSSQFGEAVVNFKTSSEILETRIKNLEEHGAPEVDKEKNPFYSVEKEVAEIKALLPEIKAKIADMEDIKQEAIKSMIASLKEQSQSADGAGPSSSSSAAVTNGSTPKPVTDISHLVRKKRKPEEETPSDSGIVKKACTEEANK